MRKIKVSKVELLKKLKDNRENHKKMVLEAQEGFKIESRKKLETLLGKVKRNELVDFHSLYKLNQPMDKTEDYDRAIEMLNMEVEENVTIDENEFRCFVQDQWGWSDQMSLSNTKYLSR